jgi:elongation factor P
MIIVHNGELHRAHSVLHKTPGNLRGFVQAKLRNLTSGTMNEHRFRSEDRVERASLDTHEMQYLYSDGEGHHFMNQETYDQIRLSDEVVGDAMKYLLPETVITVDFHGDRSRGLATVDLRVVETESGRRARPRPPPTSRRNWGGGCRQVSVRQGRPRDQDRRGDQSLERVP